MVLLLVVSLRGNALVSRVLNKFLRGILFFLYHQIFFATAVYSSLHEFLPCHSGSMSSGRKLPLLIWINWSIGFLRLRKIPIQFRFCNMVLPIIVKA